MFFLAIFLVIADPSNEEEGAPENKHVVDELRIKLELHLLPVRQVLAFHRPAREAEHPDHLFADTNGDAEWYDVRKNTKRPRLLNARTQPQPEQPAEHAPDQVLGSPSFQE